MLLAVPKTSAKTPTAIKTAFRTIIQTVTSSQYVANSMIKGTMMPSNEKQKAPISPMNGPIVGTATAIITEKSQPGTQTLLIIFIKISNVIQHSCSQ